MWMARIICSNGQCEEEREVVVDGLNDLDDLACECGCGFVLIAVSALTAVHG